jgi:pyridoxamine 5'-phosphate oxidase
MQIDIEHLREDYRLASLDVKDVDENPIAQFGKWLKEALDAQVPEPNAMTLATCTPEGKPAARIVLLKGYDEAGFVFFTNYESRKGKELLHNPNAALVFSWLELQRQVRIEGKVQKVAPEQSTAYFQSRPKGSQIGAWASPQSRVIGEREMLEEKVQKLEEKYANEDELPRPKHWGGYVVQPRLIEFWQGRPSRLHDRIQYTLQSSGNWLIERLAP